MLDSKQSGKKKTRNGQEVEMVQTSDNFLSKPPPATEGDGEAFAQPKGVQTRAAIARHLAAKLKIDETMSPDEIFAQYDKIMLEQKGSSKTHWDQAIQAEREKV